MAIVVDWTCTVRFQPDGASGMTVPSSQALSTNTLFGANSGSIVVAGGYNPTSTQLKTACTTAGTNMGTSVTTTANLATIQGWQNGSN